VNERVRGSGSGRIRESFEFVIAREFPADILQELLEQDLTDRISLIFKAQISGQQQTWPQMGQSSAGFITDARSGADGSRIERIKRNRRKKRMTEIYKIVFWTGG